MIVKHSGELPRAFGFPQQPAEYVGAVMDDNGIGRGQRLTSSFYPQRCDDHHHRGQRVEQFHLRLDRQHDGDDDSRVTDAARSPGQVTSDRPSQ